MPEMNAKAQPSVRISPATAIVVAGSKIQFPIDKSAQV